MFARAFFELLPKLVLALPESLVEFVRRDLGAGNLGNRRPIRRIIEVVVDPEESERRDDQDQQNDLNPALVFLDPIEHGL